MQLKDFTQTAKSLAKNPLGIIALFIVMVYAIAGLVINFASPDFYQSPYHPAVMFLVIFPLCVLFVFTYLVSRHHQKLYSPSDYIIPDDFAKTFSVQTEQGAKITMSDEESRAFIKDTFDALIEAYNGVLSESQRELFRQIADANRPLIVSKVIPNFDRNNPRHLGELRALRGMALIKPIEGARWDVGSRIILTDFGRKISSYIEKPQSSV